MATSRFAPLLGRIGDFARNNSNALLGLASGIDGKGGGFAGFLQGSQLDQQAAERRRLEEERAAQEAAFSDAYAGMGLPPELLGILDANPALGADLAFDFYMPDEVSAPLWEDLGPDGPLGQRNTQTGQIVYAPEYLQPGAGGPDFGEETTLRTQFNGLTQGYRTVAESYTKVQAAASDPSAAGDLALIFSFMKMLDPGSVVREQEFANAQNAAGVPDQIRNLWNRLLSGERLNPNQRADFLGQAANLMQAVQSTYDQQAAFYGGLATQYGMDPARIVPPALDYGGSAPQMTGAGEEGGSSSSFAPVQIRDATEYELLDPGTPYIDPNGVYRIKGQ